MLLLQRRTRAATTLASLSTLALAAPALAQEATPPASLGTLPTIQVTATRTPQPIARAGSAVTVITAEEIARESSRNIDDLLRRVPGVTLTQSGGPGTLQTVRIRGGDVRHTLVLIDGIRVNDPSSTGREFDFSNLVLTDIERIEVLRGPQSALYGSDAMGGVVNIITRRGRGAPKGRISVEGGSYGTKEIKAGVSGSTGRVSYALSATGFDTAGFSAYGFRIPRLRHLAPGGFEPDAAQRLGLTGRIGLQLTDTTLLEVGGSANRNRSQYDAAFGQFPDTPSSSRGDLLHGYARLVNEGFGGVLRSQLTLYGNRTDRLNRDFSYFSFGGPITTFAGDTTFVGDRRGIEYQGDLKLGAFGTLTFGGAAERETADGFSRDLSSVPSFTTRDFAADRTTRSAFAQHQFSLGERWHVSVGGRLDDVVGVDRFATWRVTSAYEIRETETKLRASVGTGGKAPSLFQLFSAFGSPNLESERVFGVDAGIDQSLFDGGVVLSGTVFANRYRNLIDFASGPGVCRPGQPFGCYVNVARAETTGLELAATLDVVPQFLKVRLTYTHLEAEDRTTNRRLARRPENEGRLALTFTPTDRLTIEPRLILVGERFSSPNERLKLQPYARLDVYADYRVTDHLSVFARAENLTDARYEEVFGYGTTGRAVYGGLRATW